jgi:hypothetical protein
VVEQFHIGQRARLTRTLATRPEGLFRRGATGTVIYMEEMVSIRMDQHFPQLDHLDNAMWVKYSDITAETGGVAPQGPHPEQSGSCHNWAAHRGVAGASSIGRRARASA